MAGILLPLISHALPNPDSSIAWIVDLGAHWQWLYLSGLLVAGGIASWGHKGWASAFLVVPIVWISVAPQAQVTTQKSQIFSVASANVNLDNQSPEQLIQWIAQEQPDVLVLLEVSPVYAAELKSLTGYPYRYMVPDDSPFGMALLSRSPMLNAKTILNAESIGRIEAEIFWSGHLVSVVAYHPMPPIATRYHRMRNTELAQIATRFSDEGHPAILAGDLNATPWSSAFHGLEALGLKRVTGLKPTWPAIGQGWLGIPIDHVLATKHWQVIEHHSGSDIGSDHLPVIVRLSLVAN
ncbi:MAG: endonuclease/exonuclease/phosphatase family protein [Rhodocyclaceae bacterium]|nr:endonuclease/exonuclease/phosphatase family protein [Rhodocyclaceae bacterium]